jgi:hypothetical protein
MLEPPLMLGAPPPPQITCEALKNVTRPTPVTRGEKGNTYHRLISEGVGKCVPGARQVVFPNLYHDAPSCDPAAFSAALFEFLARSPGL